MAKQWSVWAAVVVVVLLHDRALAQSRETLAIVGVTVIDTSGGRATTNRTVTIRDGIIASVAANDVVPPGARRVDGRGRFLIPGLWDMHTHHQLTGEASLPIYVANGVTGTRDMGGDLETILPLRQRTQAGQLLGPRIIAAGPILDNRPPEWPLRLTVRTADDGRNAVRSLKSRGVDFIKVHDATPVEAYLAIAEEAKRQNLVLAGHLPRGITVEQAVSAGQRSIEHLASLRLVNQCLGGQPYSEERCRSLFDDLAKSGIWQTPTLVNWRKMFTLDTPDGNPDQDHVAYLSPGFRDFLSINRQMSNLTPQRVRDMIGASETAAKATSGMQKAGVGILAGCDGMVPGFCLHDELALMVEGGMSAAAALQTATVNPAKYLGLEKTFGSVEVGKTADLVLLDGNPLEDIANIRRTRAVVLDGRYFDRPALDELLAKARNQFQTSGSKTPSR